MDFDAMSEKDLRTYLKDNGVKFWPGAKKEELVKKAKEFKPPQPKTDVQSPTDTTSPQTSSEGGSVPENVAMGNVDTIKASSEVKSTPIVDAPPPPPPKAVVMAEYDPTTHIVVKRKVFETMLVDLVANRTQMYVRQNLLHKLSLLLEVSMEESRNIYTELMHRVMKG